MANAPLSKAGRVASIAASTARSSTISENQKWMKAAASGRDRFEAVRADQ
jgi:hypothetical protein